MGNCVSVNDTSKKEKEKKKEKQEENILNEHKEEIENMKIQFEQQIKNLEDEIDNKMKEIKMLENQNKDSNKTKIEALRKEIQLKLKEKKNKLNGMDTFAKLYSELETQKDIKAIKQIYNKVVDLLKEYKINNEEFIKKKEENEEIIDDHKEFFENLNGSPNVSNDIEEEMKRLEADYKEDNLPSANKENINIKQEILNQNNKKRILAN